MWNCLQEEETRCKKADDDEKKPKDKAKVTALFICLGGDASNDGNGEYYDVDDVYDYEWGLWMLLVLLLTSFCYLCYRIIILAYCIVINEYYDLLWLFMNECMNGCILCYSFG